MIDPSESAHVRARRMVALNESGYRCGETHHNATIPDAVVAQCRELHEDQHLGYRRIARLLGLSRDTVRRICLYETRVDVPREWKRIGSNPP